MSTDKNRAVSQAEDITPDAARQALAQDQAARRRQYLTGLAQLTRQTGFDVAPYVQLPGGELVALASFLEALGVRADPKLLPVER